MYRAIVYVGLFSAVLVSTEAQACGAEAKVVVNKGCGYAGAVEAPFQSTCALSEPAEETFQTASFYNTCDGDKPAGKDKDKGEGNICSLSISKSKAVCKAGAGNKSEQAVFSYLDPISHGVCVPGAGQSNSASAGG